MIHQAESAECGLACIAMIAKYYGSSDDLASMRMKYPFSIRGARLRDLVEVAGHIGMAARPVKFEMEDIAQLKLPCILHWDMTHYVVLTGVSASQLIINDPARGTRKLPYAEASPHVTGVALELDPGPDIRRKETAASISLTQLAGSIKGLGTTFLQVIALAAFLELLGLLAPQFMKLIVDNVLSSGDHGLLTFLGISFSLLLIVRTVVESLRSWVILWLGANFNIGWTANVFSHMLRIPIDYFAKRQVGDVISRFGSVAAIQQTVTTQFTVVLLDGVMAAVIAIVMTYYSWKLSVITIAFAIAYLSLRAAYFKYFRELTQKNINFIAVQQGNLIETIRSILTLRVNNQATVSSARYMNATANALNAGASLQKFGLIFTLFGGLIVGAQKIAVLWVGAHYAIGGELSVGMLMAFTIYADQFTNRFVSLADYYVQFRLLRVHGERLADIVLTEPENSVHGTYGAPLQSHDIELKSVFFRYGANSPYILRDVSLCVPSGTVVAITGPSGCGKSTVAKVLIGALEHQSGRIMIGGVDRDAIGRAKARNMISCVLQDDHLLNGTILENITFFDESPNMDRVREVARLVNMDVEIERMPMAYHSAVGDMGSSLSGGQKQRLFLARALYRDPKILLLDEATSHLDVGNENHISHVVRTLGITTLIIAHRPETIASADAVYEMNRDGSIVQSRTMEVMA